MLPKSQRLRKTKEIELLFKKGKSVYLGALGLKAYPNQLNYPRFTILVNKKVSKKAVERNRLKRQLRAFLEIELSKTLGFDLIVICQPAALNLESAELIKQLKVTLERLKLLWLKLSTLF